MITLPLIISLIVQLIGFLPKSPLLLTINNGHVVQTLGATK